MRVCVSFGEIISMSRKFNENLVKAIEASSEAAGICRQAMIDATDESCRAMYSAILKDCEKHLDMLKGEVELHKKQKKWDT